MDFPTTRGSRISMACICIDLDLVKNQINEFEINFKGESFVLKVIYEFVPPYCVDLQAQWAFC